MTRQREDLLARVPTLTEVADGAQLRAPTRRPTVDLAEAGWIDQAVARLEPQVHGAVSRRLRDVLGPAIQDAVQGAVREAVERCHDALVDELMQALRQTLRNELSHEVAVRLRDFHQENPPA